MYSLTAGNLHSLFLCQSLVCVKSWNTLDYQERLNKLHLETFQKRYLFKQCHLFKLIHGLFIFPIILAAPSHYNIHSNHNLLLNVPFAFSNTYYSLFCDAPRVYGTLCLTLYFHLLALTYLKLKCLKTCNSLVLLFWVHTRISILCSLCILCQLT